MSAERDVAFAESGMNAEHVADVINPNIIESQFPETFRQPGRAGAFAEGRRRNTRHFQLPVGELRLLGAKPVEGRTHLRRSRKPGYFFLDGRLVIRHFGARTDGHG